MPIILLFNWLVFGHGFGEIEIILWPSSLITMALEGKVTTLGDEVVIVVVYTAAIATNIALYCGVGAVIWLFVDQFRRR